MSINTQLKELESDMFKNSIRDGLIDIQIAFVLLTFVIAPFLSPYLGDFWSSMIFLPPLLAIMFGLRALRKNIIQPRIGSIQYNAERRKRLTWLNVIILLANLVALVLGLLSFRQFSSLSPWVHTARFSIIMLVGFSLSGYMLEFPRLYLYGIMLAAAPVIGEYLYQGYGISHHGLPVTFGITSGIIFLTGLSILIKLLRKYPAQNQEPVI